MKRMEKRPQAQQQNSMEIQPKDQAEATDHPFLLTDNRMARKGYFSGVRMSTLMLSLVGHLF